MRRYRIKSNEITVQELNGMYVVKFYFDLEELSNLVKGKLSEEDCAKFKGSVFLPVKIGINDSDLTVEATFVSTQGR